MSNRKQPLLAIEVYRERGELFPDVTMLQMFVVPPLNLAFLEFLIVLAILSVALMFRAFSAIALVGYIDRLAHARKEAFWTRNAE